MIPIDVKKKAESVLAILWDDKHESVYNLRDLRKSCPCATCRSTKTTEENVSLKVLSPEETIADDLQLNQAEVVGRYALQFTWSDGHHEGIYSFDYLRDLCQCEACLMPTDANPLQDAD